MAHFVLEASRPRARSACGGARLRGAHLRRREPVRGRLFGLSAGAVAVPRGRPAQAFHSRGAGLRLGHLHHDLGRLAGDPELDPDATPGDRAIRGVAGKPHHRAVHGRPRATLAGMDDPARSGSRRAFRASP